MWTWSNRRSRNAPVPQGTQIVFQNADPSLNPRLSVAEAIGRPLYLFNGGTSAERERRLELLDMVQA